LKKGLKTLVTQCKDGARFLFTSRYTFNLMDGRLTNVMDEINLGELSRPEAMMVMNRFPEIAKEDFGTKVEIFEKIGGHPYTINIFGQHARHKSVKDVLMDIAEVNRDMVDFTIIDMSYANLGGTARDIINRISVFRKGTVLEGLEWMMKDNGSLPRLRKEIEELIHWGLLTKLEERDRSSYQAHSIVKDFIRTKLQENERRQWLIKAGRYYENMARTSHSPWDNLDAHELYWEAGEYDKAGNIVAGVMEYLYRWGFMELIKRLNEQTIATSSGRVKAAAYHNLGVVHQGDYEKAIEKYNLSLKINEELGNKSGIASNLHQLGTIYEAKREYKRALKNYVIALRIFKLLRSPYVSPVVKWINRIREKLGEETFKKYSDEIETELGRE
jgi:tetratricopeptide (TPR) repeat protein